jgi:geranylgeranyl pyrophosphate synthase
VLVVGYGGTVEARSGTPAMASLHRLNQARYRLREVTRELKEGKGKDERGLATLTMAASSSGEVLHMAAVAEMTNVASP